MKLNEICVTALHSRLIHRTARPGGNALDFYSGGFGLNLCRNISYFQTFRSLLQSLQGNTINVLQLGYGRFFQTVSSNRHRII